MNQSQQEQQCFIPARQDEENEITPKPSSEECYDFNISSILPSANQLIYKQLPKDMISRTCFLQLNMKKYPQLLDVEDEQPDRSTQSYIKGRNVLKNQANKSLREYFKHQQFKVIYDRISKYASMRFSQGEMMSRFKNISFYQEYHQKMFKRLEQYEENQSTYVLDDDNFDSNFQCGNLGKVYVRLQQVSREYFLLLENDINSHGYTSWFFFKVLSCGSGTVKFHILNLVKTPSMYRNGMKISVFSPHQWKQSGRGWFKGGQNIQAYQNNFPKQFKEDSCYSSLYFEYTFDNQEEEVYFSMSQPYSYSRISTFIAQNYYTTEENQQKRQISEFNASQRSIIDVKIEEEEQAHLQSKLKCQIITQVYSICNNMIPIIELYQGQLQKSKRKAIVFMARQHPAEVVGSFIMEQIMKYFGTMQDAPSQILQQFLVIYIPMVNPDGVIHGNSRCNFAGLDLNRQWAKQSLKETTPQNVSLRKYIWSLHQKHGIQYLIDLHGHSKKMGSFFFCSKNSDKKPPWYFPFVVSKIEPIFDLNSCTYNITPDKKNTLRNQLYQEGMKHCLTLQNSYVGYYTSQGTIKNFTKQSYKSLAQSIVKSLHFILLADNGQEKPGNIFQALGISRQNFTAAYEANKKQVANRVIPTIQQQLQLQSDSEPQQGILRPQQMQKILDFSDDQKKIKKQSVNHLESTKFKSRKPKKSISTTKKEQLKQQDIRLSYPSDIRMKQNQSQGKFHKSQKKIKAYKAVKSVTKETKIIRPELTIRKTGSRGLKVQQKIEKKQKLDKEQKVQKKQSNITTHEIRTKSDKKVGKSSKSLNRTGAVTVFTSYPLNNDYHIKKKKKQIFETSQSNKNRKKSIIEKKEHLPYKVDQHEIKSFLTETLSILRVNGLSQQPNKSQNQKIKDPQQQIFEKMIKSGMRVKTQSAYKMNSEQESSFYKKIMTRNYRKQILKRKKLLNKEDTFRFKRFENFVDSSPHKEEIKGKKLQGNSVFYHFPVL